MDLVFGWELRVIGITATEYFKVAIRKNPSAECWSWAYELNANTRVVGFFGNETVARDVFNRFPKFHWVTIRRGNEITRYREEVRLSAEDDKMFLP